MVRRIEWREAETGGLLALSAVAAGETVEVCRDHVVVALLKPPERALPPLRVRRASRRDGFGLASGNRASRPTLEMLACLRGGR